MDTDIGGGLLDLSAFADKRYRACADPWRVGAWHVGEPFMKAID